MLRDYALRRELTGEEKPAVWTSEQSQCVAPASGMSLACSWTEQVAGGRSQGKLLWGGQGPDLCRLWLKREREGDFIPKSMESCLLDTFNCGDSMILFLSGKERGRLSGEQTGRR